MTKIQILPDGVGTYTVISVCGSKILGLAKREARRQARAERHLARYLKKHPLGGLA